MEATTMTTETTTIDTPDSENSADSVEAAGRFEAYYRTPDGKGWLHRRSQKYWHEWYALAQDLGDREIRIVRPHNDGKEALAFQGPAYSMTESEPSSAPIVDRPGR